MKPDLEAYVPAVYQAARTLAAVRLTFEVKVPTISIETIWSKTFVTSFCKGFVCSFCFINRFIDNVFWHLGLFSTVDNEFQRLSLILDLGSPFSCYIDFYTKFCIYFRVSSSAWLRYWLFTSHWNLLFHFNLSCTCTSFRFSLEEMDFIHQIQPR